MFRNLLLPFLLLSVLTVSAQFKTVERKGTLATIFNKPIAPPAAGEKSQKVRFNYQAIGNLDALSIHRAIKVKQSDKNKMPILIKGNLDEYSNDLSRQTFEYLEAVASFYKVKNAKDEWIIRESSTDEIGMQHVKVQQVYKGVPIFAGELNLHAKNGRIETLMGRGYPSPEVVSVVPQIEKDQAERQVWDKLKSMDHFVKIDLSRKENKNLKQVDLSLVIYHEDEKADGERLAYHVKAYENLASWKTYFMDANTGEIIHEHDNICKMHGHLPPDGPTTAVAQDQNGQNRTIDVYEVGGNFFMINAAKPNFSFSMSTMPDAPVGVIWTVDARNSSPQTDDFNIFHVANSNNTSWNDRTSVSAHFNASIAYDYFKDVHGRNAIDGVGGNIMSFINVTDEDDEDMDNAFWNGQGMYYGNGNVDFKPLAGALDVAGHEMTHGVVQTTANLNYQGESGALNESFADIFGAMMDREDYQMGEDVVTSSFPSGALRDLSNPNQGGSQLGQPGYQPATVSQQYFGDLDNGGVHINSGIPNFAFFKIAEAIGKDKAEKAYYRALTQYLTRSSQFVDARNAVVQSVTDLYGSAEVNAANTAFDQVGIGAGSGGDYTNDANVNPGAQFLVYADMDRTKLALVNAALESVLDPASASAPISKPSVTDDGSFIYYVNSDNQIAYTTINWDTGDVGSALFSDQQIWSNVVISKDGNRMAAVESAQSNRIQVYDFNLGEFYKDAFGNFGFELYNPTFTEGISTGDAKFADAMDFDISGEILMYDSYSEISGDFGQTIGFWDIGFLEVFDNSKADWGNGNINKLFNSLGEDVSIGNPTFAKNSPYIIAFDLIDGNQNIVYAVNVENGDQGVIFENTSLGYPSYTADDKQMVFNSESTFDSDIFLVDLADSKIESIGGSAGTLIEDAIWGTPFNNGTRVLSNVTEKELLVEKLDVFPNPATDLITFEVKLENPTEALVEITNMEGKMMTSKTQKLSSGLSQHKLSVTDLPQGNYTINLIAEGVKRTAMFVKL